MKTVIILHGTLGSPQGNWFEWLIPGQGHFNLEHSAAYKTFPKLLDLLQKVFTI